MPPREHPTTPGVPERATSNLTLDDDVRASIQILLVDDEQTMRDGCSTLLKAAGYSVESCRQGSQALELLERRSFDIVLADVFMPNVSGMEVLKAALDRNPNTIVIMMTGNPSVDTSLEAMRAGAWDYVPKPFSATHLEILIGRAAHTVAVARERGTAGKEYGGQRGSPDAPSRNPVLIGDSVPMRTLARVALQVARTDASVFLMGESGTGKELIARMIHRESRRATRELVAVNCAALPETLLESEMFGHVEGAFTGAVRTKKGLLEIAHGGTLFLDELTEMPMSIQAKLLRVIQDGVLRRLGSTQTDAVVNVRFIAATNMDPAEAVALGKLRKDLFYRLRVVPIVVPPLRQRQDDIPKLADHFLNQFWTQHRPNEGMPTITPEGMAALVECPWQGNVRELRNVIEHAVVLSEPGANIGAEDLPFIQHSPRPGGTDGIWDTFALHGDYHEARERVLASFERGYLSRVVKRANGNMSDAAKLAGVDRTTLYRLTKKHGLDPRSLRSTHGEDSESVEW
ncbi:MAG: sigma-54-dependent transcriptional regulator [Longimicrobiales bacterium]